MHHLREVCFELFVLFNKTIFLQCPSVLSTGIRDLEFEKSDIF